ncbi:MAG: formylglycine-generating enzyme family protein [Planctomycetes bacterium]|nr:formylglycine-generating enzyme family protein [Planctomycetota bacterium]
MVFVQALAFLLAFVPQLKPAAPPGLVWIDGGRTKIGTSVDQALALGQKYPVLFNAIAAETPQHERKVDGFFLMVNEVTNEQYAAFVQATGHRPPRSWGRAAIEEAQRRFPAEESERRAKAREAGQDPGADREFDAEAWWSAHSGDEAWTVPAGEECLPVVFVDHADARAYARWAGLRLMTEFEYQRAGRMNSASLYPWGNDWDDDAYCANQAQRESRPRPVGSFHAGATRTLLEDLAGNVWEWTANAYAGYPGYKELQIRVQRDGELQVIDSIARFDPLRRVIVGGSFQNGRLEARLSTRRAVEATALTDALGFRCAASDTRFADLTQNVIDLDLAGALEPFRLSLDANTPLCIDRWSSAPGTATRQGRDENGKPRVEALPGYAVITGYEYLLFVSATGLVDSSLAELRERVKREGRVALGVFSTSRKVEGPNLAAGTYVVALARDESDPTRDRLSFAKPTGEIAATIELARIEFGRPAPAAIELSTGGDGATPDRASFRTRALSRVSQRGVSFEFTLDFAPASLGSGWRR